MNGKMDDRNCQECRHKTESGCTQWKCGFEEKIKPCPFCKDGGDPKVMTLEYCPRYRYVVMCVKCGCKLYDKEDRAEVIRRWNERG